MEKRTLPNLSSFPGLALVTTSSIYPNKGLKMKKKSLYMTSLEVVCRRIFVHLIIHEIIDWTGPALTCNIG